MTEMPTIFTSVSGAMAGCLLFLLTGYISPYLEHKFSNWLSEWLDENNQNNRIHKRERLSDHEKGSCSFQVVCQHIFISRIKYWGEWTKKLTESHFLYSIRANEMGKILN